MLAEVIELLIGTDQRSVIAEEGQTVRSWLRVVAGCTGADERTLVLAAQRLVHLPTVRRWLADGTCTWPVVRSIVFTTRRLTVAQLAWLDETLTADARRLRRLDADGVIDVVDRLAADARPDLAADRTQRQFDRRYAQVQTGVDGSVQLYAEFDAEMGAAVIQALETTPVSDPPDDAPGHAPGNAEEHRHTGARQAAEPQPGRSAGQRRADALYALCLQRRTAASGGGHGVEGAHGIRPAAPAQARPSVLVMTDIATLTGTDDRYGGIDRTAELLWRASRGPTRLTDAAVRRQACHGEVRPVLMDGAVPLGVGAPIVNVGAPLRAALVARDVHCRFPGCREAAERCENHHVVHRVDGGPTVLENLALLCPAHHRAVHEGGWRATLDEDGIMTFRRRERRLTTVPFHDRRCVPSAPPPRRRRPPPRGAPPLVPATQAHDDEALPF